MKTKFTFPHHVNNYFSAVLIFISISLVFLGSCKQASPALSKAEMKAIVEKQNEVLGNCFINGNADKLAEMYTDSAKLSPNGSRFIVGRDSIKSFWKEDFKSSKVLKMKTMVMTIDGNENLIYETGYALSDILYNDTLYHARVKYINVWCKQSNGAYKLDVDFWNKDASLTK